MYATIHKHVVDEDLLEDLLDGVLLLWGGFRLAAVAAAAAALGDAVTALEVFGIVCCFFLMSNRRKLYL